ncbi:MAG TPA: GNAT family N-acetyltransferase [Steroidobacteraceae bacterium]
MNDLPQSLFTNPIWHALQSMHRRFALSAGAARRYCPDVAPFASVAAPTADALTQLHLLLAPEESFWVIGDTWPGTPLLRVAETLPCLQMMRSLEGATLTASANLLRLGPADIPEMIALTDHAFPGFFRARTLEMGSYYGVRIGGDLVAMGGERLLLDGYPEISGVCTHPGHRGKGFAADIIGQLTEDHRRAGLLSWLHVGVANTHAVELYRRLEFQVIRKVTFNRLVHAA